MATELRKSLVHGWGLIERDSCTDVEQLTYRSETTDREKAPTCETASPEVIPDDVVSKRRRSRESVAHLDVVPCA